ncbi:IS3 family transposase [Psychrobium sp. MM17-31]|uniref:IS3 family transposase n=1 Tax=Psychrobium sp. MM17-31 TaxID=2917758 RepID=UPI001EF410DA|nr:IS3 family transposase [Psychrobium sp. MM17-31]MCG7532725.1 IS3 family transposase [Psychrobium sp. MM17-31]
MSAKRFPEEFKIQAVKQVTEKGHAVASVAERLDISTNSLYNWLKRYGSNSEHYQELSEQDKRIRELEKELKRTQQERDLLKEGRRVLCGRVKEKYTFIKSRLNQYPIKLMCQALQVHRSGFHAWLKKPESERSIDDRRLTGLIKQSWLESDCVYGYRKIQSDMRDLGEACSKNRVHRLMQLAGIQAQVGYKKRKGNYGTKPSVVADNQLKRQFDVVEPNQAWVTDITYIDTHEGFLYLAVVIDLFSRQVICWSMQSMMHTDLVLSALLAAVWRRKPKQTVIIHSDQGSQFTGYDWQRFAAEHNLSLSMSRRGNCHDNAVAESFFQLLKRERIKRRKYKSREKAKEDIFDYIEMFYNSKRKHGYLNNQSPADYDRTYFMHQENV